MASSLIAIGQKVDERWQVLRLLGEGGYGAVFEVVDLVYGGGERKCALKVEDATAPLAERLMRMDVIVLRRMRTKKMDETGEKRHFCRLEGIGQTPQFRFIVMTLVGKSCQELRRLCEGRFTGRTVAHIGIESLKAIRKLHEIDYLHRDIKSANLAIGPPPHLNRIYLIDFGMARNFRHDNTGRHRRPRVQAGFKGTLTYASIACHKYEDMCRRDDLWSWLYALIEMSTGQLPWQQTLRSFYAQHLEHKVMIEKVGEIKTDLQKKPTELMAGCAIEFMALHQHVASLGYYDRPDYELLLRLLGQMESRRRRPDKDGETLDWEPGGKHASKIQF